MTDVEAFLANVKQTVAALKQSALAPCLEDGTNEATAVTVATNYRDNVLAKAPTVLPQLDGDERRPLADGLQEITTQLVGALVEVKAVALAQQLVEATLQHVPTAQLRPELMAARGELELFAKLVKARWLMAHGEGKLGAKVADDVYRRSRDRVLSAAARALAEVTEPIKRPPTLQTINGIGTSLYGKADPAPDGSYTATQYLVFLFIPIFPLSRYVVSDAGGGAWYFHARRRLSRLQTWYRRVVVVGALLALGTPYLPDVVAWSGYEARQAAAAASALEGAGKTKEAVVAWEAVLTTYPDASARVLGPALEHWLGLKANTLPPSCAADDGAATLKLLRRAEDWPLPARVDSVKGWVDDHVKACAQQLAERAHGDGASERATLQQVGALLASADHLTGHQFAALKDLQLRLARSWASEGWPLQAIAAALELQAPELTAFAAEQFAQLGDVGTLLVEERETVELFLARASTEVGAPTKAALQRALELEQAPGREALLESGSVAALQARLKEAPGDQQVAVALADALARVSDWKGALAVLEQLGPPGKRTVAAQFLGVGLLRATDQRKAADAALEDFVARNVPRYVAARAAFDARGEQIEQATIARLRSENVPADLRAKLEANEHDEDKQRELLREFFAEEIRRDSVLVQRRDRLARLSTVVEAATSWGTQLVSRASRLEGDKRKAVLNEAERVFLAVKGDAEGSPSFKLGYGQVLHRLGRVKEGDEQLMGLARDAPALKLGISEVYRELGLEAQARTLALEVQAAGGDDADEAARTLEVMGRDHAERVKWNAAIKKPLPVDKSDKAQLDGAELMTQGKYREAALAYQAAAAFHLKSADHSPVAANNAALALERSLDCAFDEKVWQQVLRLQRSALATHPDNSVLLVNTASVLLTNAVRATVLAHTGLPPAAVDREDAWLLWSTLTEGPRAAPLRERFLAHPDAARGLELLEQHHALAPQAAGVWQTHAMQLYMAGDVAGMLALVRRAARAGVVGDTSPTSAQERERGWAFADAKLARLLALKREGLERTVLALTRCRIAERTRPDVTHASQHVGLCREAGGWNEVDARPLMAGAAARLGVAVLADTHPALRQALADNPGVNGVSVTWKLAHADPALATAAAERPEFKEALSLLSDQPDSRLWQWMLADLVHDQASKQLSVQRLERPLLSVTLYFDRLEHDPSEPYDQAALAAMFTEVPPELRSDWDPGK